MLDWLAGNAWWEWVLVAALVAVVAFAADRLLHKAGGARNAFDWCVVAFAAAVVGLIASFVMDFVSLADETYGDVPVPGSTSMRLPAGDVLITLKTDAVGRGVGAVIPENLELVITPPSGIPKPSVTDLLGDDAAEPAPRRSEGYEAGEAIREAMIAHIPVAGDYTITSSGTDPLSTSPRLTFGRDSIFDFLTWPFFPCLIAVTVVAGLVAYTRIPDEPEGGPVMSDSDLLASGQRVPGVLKSFTKSEATKRRKAPVEPELPAAPYYALEVELRMPTLVRVAGRNRQQVPLTEVPKLAVGRELTCVVDPSAPSSRFIIDWRNDRVD
ncbi:hypothetical protein ACIA48_03715 [Mycobacterium sp. NPDC051804]|uniref:hypothetical protein n=1 Tax=Mycobacterium sp. NPDC051804 TaxID=3364295 RepID=UPI0037B1FC6C